MAYLLQLVRVRVRVVTLEKKLGKKEEQQGKYKQLAKKLKSTRLENKLVAQRLERANKKKGRF